MKRLLRIPLLLAFALSLLCLAGCSPSLQNEDVVGTWKTSAGDSAELEDQGIYTFYHFNDDGSFVLEGWVKGASTQRTGTWEIQDDKVIVNVPEGEAIETSTISADAPAIENGEITIEDGTLTTNAIGNQEVTGQKVSDEDYQAAVEDSKAKGPKSISVGTPVTTDLYTFTVDSIDYEDAIYPSDTSGYYTYFTDQAGSTYLVAHVTFKNESSEYMVPGYSLAATYSINGNNYDAGIELDAGTLYGKSYSVEAKDTASMIIYAVVPDEVVNSGATSLTLSVPKSIDYFQTYASYVTDPDQYVITL